MTDSNKQSIVSMLVSPGKLMLITVDGNILDMKDEGIYDIDGIVELLSSQLNGTNIVELNLHDYLNISKAIIPDGYETKGIVMKYEMDGKMVQGIFYPQKVNVAVTHEGEDILIPNVEKLNKHADRAAKENSPSVRNFLRRIAPVVKERLHSAEDLMSFIERSELPLTNDGLIIGYKKVNQVQKGIFVDVHSGKVQQQVGSHVWMDVNGVDPDRNQSCSHGLHVANLGYLSGFSGSHTLIVLVDPANFIAVPHGETNKARVCAYDVIGVMTTHGHNMVDSGSFVKDDQTFESVIRDAVAGRAIQPFEAVKVGDRCVLERVAIKGREIPNDALEQPTDMTLESSGKSLNMDQIEQKERKNLLEMVKTAKGEFKWSNAPDEVLKAFLMIKDNVAKAEIARTLNTSTRSIGRWMEKYGYEDWVNWEEVIPEPEPSTNDKPLTIAEQAQLLFDRLMFSELREFKKTKKKSWTALGFGTEEIKIIEQG